MSLHNVGCHIFLFVCPPVGAWAFSVSELAAPGVEVGRLTATDADVGDNALLDFTIMDAEEAQTFNISAREREAIIVLNKVSVSNIAAPRKKPKHFLLLLTINQEATQSVVCGQRAASCPSLI